jgi:hypothetical protein
MQTCHITSCNVTFLHWKLIMKTIVVHLIHSTIWPTRPNWVISHLLMCHRLITVEVVLPCRRLTFPPLSHTLSPPLLKRKSHCLPSPPPFQPPILLQLRNWRIEIHYHRQALPIPTLFLLALRPIKGIERAIIPHHTPSRMSSQNEDCKLLPFISVSQLIPLPCHPTSPRRWALHHLPLSHRCVTATYCGP